MSKKKSKVTKRGKPRLKPISKADRDAAILMGISAITPEMKRRAVPVEVADPTEQAREKNRSHKNEKDTRKAPHIVTGLNVRDDYLLALKSKHRLEEGAFEGMTGPQLADVRMAAAERWSWDWHLCTLAVSTTLDYKKLMLGRTPGKSQSSVSRAGITDIEQIRSDARKRFNTALLTIPPTIQQATLDLVIDRKKPYADGTPTSGIVKARTDALTGIDLLAIHYGMMEQRRVMD